MSRIKTVRVPKRLSFAGADFGRYSESPSAAVRDTGAFEDGNALQATGRFAEAIGCYDRAISLKPDYMEAYRNRGNALRRLGRLAEAVEAMTKPSR